MRIASYYVLARYAKIKINTWELEWAYGRQRISNNIGNNR